MTVADLIRELQTMPQGMAVRVVTASVTIMDIEGDFIEQLCDEDATEADEVRHMGPWVLIRGK